MIHSNTLRSAVLPRLKPFVALLSLCIVLLLLIWSLEHYRPAPNFYGPRAIYSLILLSLFLALLGRVLLLRLLRSEPSETAFVHHARSTNQSVDAGRGIMQMGLTTTLAETEAAPRSQIFRRLAWQPLFLFDITAPLYLAAGVLIGVPAAVLTAVVTQVFLQGYTYLHGFVSRVEACYRIASTVLLVLISDAIYTWIAGPPQNYMVSHFRPLAESREFLGSILAAIVMMVLIILASLPSIRQASHASLMSAWQQYLHSPALRFQVLVLSVGPLLPVVDIFDDAAGEIAWLFFLVPLFAIYYLALSSTRLSILTDELEGTLRDLKSARRRQDELRDYASLVTRVQEEERRRLARELHDDTAQALIALSLGLDGLGRAMGKRDLPEKDVQWLINLQTLADRTLEGVRRACRDLRPSVLDDLGLRAALEWLSDSSAERGLPCIFTCLGLPQAPPPEAEIAIFRIAQEALSNVWRHAHATQAEIALHYLPGILEVTIHDDGKGFAADQAQAWLVGTPFSSDGKEHSSSTTMYHSSQRGLGLVGMRERAMLIGARLQINSSPGKGCSVVLSLPL